MYFHGCRINHSWTKTESDCRLPFFVLYILDRKTNFLGNRRTLQTCISIRFCQKVLYSKSSKKVIERLGIFHNKLPSISLLGLFSRQVLAQLINVYRRQGDRSRYWLQLWLLPGNWQHLYKFY
jgi:uncharacterized membrane protein